VPEIGLDSARVVGRSDHYCCCRSSRSEQSLAARLSRTYCSTLGCRYTIGRHVRALLGSGRVELLLRFAPYGGRPRVLDREPLVTATAHLQVGFRKGVPLRPNARGEETCNVNFGSLSIVESVDLKLCTTAFDYFQVIARV
jgi:hypothetical protein